MADCLKRNVDVQEPVYCLDDQEAVVPGTAMYEWMSVRAYGPNVLHDTTLCGTTTIEAPFCPPDPVMGLGLYAEVSNTSATGTQTLVEEYVPAAAATWYPVAVGQIDVVPPVAKSPNGFSMTYCLAPDLFDQCVVDTYGATAPFLAPAPFNQGANNSGRGPNIINNSGRSCLSRITLSAGIELSGAGVPAAGDLLWKFALANITSRAAPVIYAPSQKVHAFGTTGITETLFLEVLAELAPDDIVGPVDQILQLTGSGFSLNWQSINMHVEIISWDGQLSCSSTAVAGPV